MGNLMQGSLLQLASLGGVASDASDACLEAHRPRNRCCRRSLLWLLSGAEPRTTGSVSRRSRQRRRGKYNIRLGGGGRWRQKSSLLGNNRGVMHSCNSAGGTLVASQQSHWTARTCSVAPLFVTSALWPRPRSTNITLEIGLFRISHLARSL